MIDLLTIVFATWYISYAVSSTHGPGGVFDWLREHVWHGRHERIIEERIPAERPETISIVPGLLDCPVCLAPWVALVLLLAPMGIVTQALAAAGLAMILHGWSGWRFAQ